MTLVGAAWAGMLMVAAVYQESRRVPGTMSAPLTPSPSQPGADRYSVSALRRRTTSPLTETSMPSGVSVTRSTSA